MANTNYLFEIMVKNSSQMSGWIREKCVGYKRDPEAIENLDAVIKQVLLQWRNVTSNTTCVTEWMFNQQDIVAIILVS